MKNIHDIRGQPSADPAGTKSTLPEYRSSSCNKTFYYKSDLADHEASDVNVSLFAFDHKN
jgi:hypothetical protein